jgi:limonene-1,2-epoxide hydrolase
MSQTNEELMRAFLALWSARDAAGMAGMFAEDGVYDNVPDKKPMVGRPAIRAWLDMCFEHLTRIDVDVLHVASNGEWVLSERLDDHVHGDKHMVLPVMNAARVVDGKFVMFRDYYCRKTVAELGMG